MDRTGNRILKKVTDKVKESARKFWVKLLCAAIFISATGVAAYSYVNGKVEEVVDTMQQIDKEEVKELENENIPEEVKEVELRDNWLIAGFGLDSRNGNLDRANSDVIMLANINGKTGKIKLASIYRDTCLKVTEGSYRKANAAYAIGGPKQAVQMLNENFDLEIDDYISVNWATVAKAINLLGGVDIDITKSEFKYINAYITETVKSTGIGSYQLKETGYQHLDGIQAVAYCRLRYTDNDFKRTERQREVLSQLLQKLKAADFAVQNQLIVELLPEVSSSIEAKDLYDLVANIGKLHLGDTEGFPNDNFTKTVNGASFVFPNTLVECTSEMHEFLFGTEGYIPSEAVEQISAAIEKKSRSNSVAKPTEEKIEEEEEEEAGEETEEENTEENSLEEIEETEAQSEDPGYVVVGGPQNSGTGPGSGIQESTGDKDNVIWTVPHNEDGKQEGPGG